jgi:hypothetical protein
MDARDAIDRSDARGQSLQPPEPPGIEWISGESNRDDHDFIASELLEEVLVGGERRVVLHEPDLQRVVDAEAARGEPECCRDERDRERDRESLPDSQCDDTLEHGQLPICPCGGLEGSALCRLHDVHPGGTCASPARK